MARIRFVAMLGAAVLAAGACSRPTPSAADDALRQDLDAAQAHAVARQTSRVQFVSPLELGRAADAPARAVPRVAAGALAAARPATRRSATPVTRVARVSRPGPVARAAEPAPAAHAPTPAAERAADAPSIDVEVAPLPTRDEPVVAAPTRPPADVPPPQRRRGRVWTTDDVIRNAPFPINP